jgi:predicted nucleic acid-binding protein
LPRCDPANRRTWRRALGSSGCFKAPTNSCSLFGVEVAGALARRGITEAGIRTLVQTLRSPPHQIVTIGPKGAAAAQTCAIHGLLRGADALYVWLASARGLPLCTLDQEMAQRGAVFCEIIAP